MGQPLIRFQRASVDLTPAGEYGEEYLHIFLPAFLFDGIFQVQLVRTVVSENEDNPIVRHRVKCDVDSWREEDQNNICV